MIGADNLEERYRQHKLCEQRGGMVRGDLQLAGCKWRLQRWP
jgi:hypothetical protein